MMTALRFYDLYTADPDIVRVELGKGLIAEQAHTSPKYLYDKLGSRLFDAITELPEYYPTRTEAAIFAAQHEALARALPDGACLVDLGAGSCAKAASLFAALQPRQYIAVDISVSYLRGVLADLSQQHPRIGMAGVGMDFSSTLDLPPALMCDLRELPVAAFYPGSSISNFGPAESLALLQRIHTLCASGAAGSGLLIGVDLVKPVEVLEPAYDDPLGVTAAFNLNMLRHINTLLGSDFDVRDWQHVAFFNAQASRIEMHLQAKRQLRVTWEDGMGSQHREFKAGERIHTENSYKWTVAQFTALLAAAGFASSQVWTDPDNYFAVVWAKI
jgi:L-histidine Nalpha-methyltransferase